MYKSISQSSLLVLFVSLITLLIAIKQTSCAVLCFGVLRSRLLIGIIGFVFRSERVIASLLASSHVEPSNLVSDVAKSGVETAGQGSVFLVLVLIYRCYCAFLSSSNRCSVHILNLPSMCLCCGLVAGLLQALLRHGMMSRLGLGLSDGEHEILLRLFRVSFLLICSQRVDLAALGEGAQLFHLDVFLAGHVISKDRHLDVPRALRGFLLQIEHVELVWIRGRAGVGLHVDLLILRLLLVLLLVPHDDNGDDKHDEQQGGDRGGRNDPPRGEIFVEHHRYMLSKELPGTRPVLAGGFLGFSCWAWGVRNDAEEGRKRRQRLACPSEAAQPAGPAIDVTEFLPAAGSKL
mmetsp:Transcript_23279/g.75692  ORF Transcript_23279/g.75692 Transcript_23279/m.75692 type:complete len:348 (+) Transcript_23279:142-1185(+)